MTVAIKIVDIIVCFTIFFCCRTKYFERTCTILLNIVGFCCAIRDFVFKNKFPINFYFVKGSWEYFFEFNTEFRLLGLIVSCFAEGFYITVESSVIAINHFSGIDGFRKI